MSLKAIQSKKIRIYDAGVVRRVTLICISFGKSPIVWKGKLKLKNQKHWFENFNLIRYVFLFFYFFSFQILKGNAFILLATIRTLMD